jgi:hypothetical protein
MGKIYWKSNTVYVDHKHFTPLLIFTNILRLILFLSIFSSFFIVMGNVYTAFIVYTFSHFNIGAHNLYGQQQQHCMLVCTVENDRGAIKTNHGFGQKSNSLTACFSENIIFYIEKTCLNILVEVDGYTFTHLIASALK